MSPSPTGTVERTPEGGRVRFERLLAFPIEEVWAAITEPERLGDWWPPMAAEITVDLREDGKITFEWPDLDFPTMEFTIVRLEPLTASSQRSRAGRWPGTTTHSPNCKPSTPNWSPHDTDVADGHDR